MSRRRLDSDAWEFHVRATSGRPYPDQKSHSTSSEHYANFT